MKLKPLALAVLTVSALAAGGIVSTPAQAGVNVDFVIGVPPPEPREEYRPDPRDGYVWVSGYWGWDGYRHVWVDGHWERERPGYGYRPAHWDREDDHWRFREAQWERQQEERREERREEERRDEYRDHDDWERHREHDRENGGE